MNSICENEVAVKTTDQFCCYWYKGREQHHDAWLSALQLMSPEQFERLQLEMFDELRGGVLPADKNSMVDLEDIALHHIHEISHKAFKQAGSLTRVAQQYKVLPMQEQYLEVGAQS